MSPTKKDPTKQYRQATIEDFKVGAELFDSEGYGHIIREWYDAGVWNCLRGNVVFESEAKFYTVETQNK